MLLPTPFSITFLFPSTKNHYHVSSSTVFNGKIKIMKKYLGILVLKLERLKNPSNYLITTRLYGPKNNNFMKKNNSTHVAFTAALLIFFFYAPSCQHHKLPIHPRIYRCSHGIPQAGKTFGPLDLCRPRLKKT